MKKTFKWVIGLALAIPGLLQAGGTKEFIDDSWSDFGQGEITTSTLTSKGILLPPYWREKIADLDADIVWDAESVGENRYIATGHDARLFRQQGTGEPELVHQFDEVALYSLAVSPSKDLFIGASPGGKIYRLSETPGEPDVFAETGQRLIWDLEWKDGHLVAATGDQGRLLRIADDGTSETIAHIPDVTNLLDLAFDPQGNPVVATEGPGMVVRVKSRDEMEVLYDPGQREVRRIAFAGDGTLVAAINGMRSPSEKILAKTGETDAKGSDKPKPSSYLMRIASEGWFEEWWESPETPIHDIHLMSDGSIFVAAGSNGVLYHVQPGGSYAVGGLIEEKYLMRLAPQPDGRFLLGTGDSAAVVLFNPNRYQEGAYDSRSLDARGSAHWGRIHGFVDEGDGALKIQVRTGNTAQPGDTWSDWSQPKDFSIGQQEFQSGIARFLQYRLLFSPAEGPGARQPSADLVKVTYLPSNSPPRIGTISVEKGPPKKDSEVSNGVLTVSWNAADSDGDPLTYDLELAPAKSRDWMTLEEKLTAQQHVLDSSALPDGYWRLRVTASDDQANPEGGKTDQKESEAFLVDHTQPEFIILTVKREDRNTVRLRVRAEDEASLISSAQWRYDLEDWTPLQPEDRIFDDKTETFDFLLTGEAAASDTLITLRARDEAGNLVTGKIDLD